MSSKQVEEDRYKEMLDRSDSENIASSYFKSKRASQLLGREPAKAHSKTCPLTSDSAVWEDKPDARKLKQ